MTSTTPFFVQAVEQLLPDAMVVGESMDQEHVRAGTGNQHVQLHAVAGGHALI